MKKLLLLITGLLLLFSVDGQILRYGNYVAPIPSTILVNSIDVWGTGGATTIATNGGTLQMLKKTLPTNAADTSATWSRINGTGTADISAGGLLTALTNGTVTVRATANDGSAVYGEEVITISNQEVTAPSFLTSDGYTEMWFIDDEANMTKNGSQLVTNWDDLSTNDFDLANEGNGAEPTWSSSGVTFNGTADQLWNTEINQAQPYVAYIVMSQLTWTIFDRLFGFQASDIYAWQRTASPSIQFVANSTYSNVDPVGLNTLFVFVVRLQGATSKVQINDGTPVTFNGGTGALNDFNIGKEEGNVLVREIIIRSVADDSTNETAILNYLMAKYGIE